MAAAPVELWSTRLSCPQIHRRISSLPQQLPSATLGEPENPSLNSDPGCIKVVDTYRVGNFAGFVRALMRRARKGCGTAVLAAPRLAAFRHRNLQACALCIASATTT